MSPRTRPLDDHLLGLLSLVETEGTAAIITEQLVRDDYVALNKVLEACGGTWNKKLKVHVFDGDAAEALDRVMVTGTYSTGGDGLGFFPTPAELAADLVKRAGIRPRQWVLEPSAGTGVIVQALRDAGAAVVAVEIDEARLLKVPQIGAGVVPIRGDFLTFTAQVIYPYHLFHAVVMNPPFRRIGIHDWIDHVRHAFTFLRPRGVLVSVTPRSIEFRQDRRHVEMRRWIGEHGTIEQLPAEAFTASGTSCRTNVIRLVKS